MLKSFLICSNKLQFTLNTVSVQKDALQLTVEEKVHKVVYQGQLLRSVKDAASVFLSSDTEGFDEKLCTSIGTMATVTGVDRIIIYKNIDTLCH